MPLLPPIHEEEYQQEQTQQQQHSVSLRQEVMDLLSQVLNEAVLPKEQNAEEEEHRETTREEKEKEYEREATTMNGPELEAEAEVDALGTINDKELPTLYTVDDTRLTSLQYQELMAYLDAHPLPSQADQNRVDQEYDADLLGFIDLRPVGLGHFQSWSLCNNKSHGADNDGDVVTFHNPTQIQTLVSGRQLMSISNTALDSEASFNTYELPEDVAIAVCHLTRKAAVRMPMEQVLYLLQQLHEYAPSRMCETWTPVTNIYADVLRDAVRFPSDVSAKDTSHRYLLYRILPLGCYYRRWTSTQTKDPSEWIIANGWLCPPYYITGRDLGSNDDTLIKSICISFGNPRGLQFLQDTQYVALSYLRLYPVSLGVQDLLLDADTHADLRDTIRDSLQQERDAIGTWMIQESAARVALQPTSRNFLVTPSASTSSLSLRPALDITFVDRVDRHMKKQHTTLQAMFDKWAMERDQMIQTKMKQWLAGPYPSASLQNLLLAELKNGLPELREISVALGDQMISGQRMETDEFGRGLCYHPEGFSSEHLGFVSRGFLKGVNCPQMFHQASSGGLNAALSSFVSASGDLQRALCHMLANLVTSTHGDVVDLQGKQFVGALDGSSGDREVRVMPSIWNKTGDETPVSGHVLPTIDEFRDLSATTHSHRALNIRDWMVHAATLPLGLLARWHQKTRLEQKGEQEACDADAQDVARIHWAWKLYRERCIEDRISSTDMFYPFDVHLEMSQVLAQQEREQEHEQSSHGVLPSDIRELMDTFCLSIRRANRLTYSDTPESTDRLFLGVDTQCGNRVTIGPLHMQDSHVPFLVEWYLRTELSVDRIFRVYRPSAEALHQVCYKLYHLFVQSRHVPGSLPGVTAAASTGERSTQSLLKRKHGRSLFGGLVGTPGIMHVLRLKSDPHALIFTAKLHAQPSHIPSETGYCPLLRGDTTAISDDQFLSPNVLDWLQESRVCLDILKEIKNNKAFQVVHSCSDVDFFSAGISRESSIRESDHAVPGLVFTFQGPKADDTLAWGITCEFWIKKLRYLVGMPFFGMHVIRAEDKFETKEEGCQDKMSWNRTFLSRNGSHGPDQSIMIYRVFIRQWDNEAVYSLDAWYVLLSSVLRRLPLSTGVVATEIEGDQVSMMIDITHTTRARITRLFIRPDFELGSAMFADVRIITQLFGLAAGIQMIALLMKRSVDPLGRLNARHFKMIAHWMASSGNLFPVHRTSLFTLNSDFAESIFFERNYKQARQAAINHSHSSFNGPFGSLLSGNLPRIGTYASDLLTDAHQAMMEST